jgi:hypothetical protein
MPGRTVTAAYFMNLAMDLNAESLAALLVGQGFKRQKRTPRILRGEWVTVACTVHGYQLEFPSDGSPMGVGVVNLPADVTYGVVEAVVLGIERHLRDAAAEG